jgi:hypothetical protein
MKQKPLELTYEIELRPGETLTLPQALVNSVGPGRWVVTIHSIPGRSSVRDHSAFLAGYEPEDEGLYDDCAPR